VNLYAVGAGVGQAAAAANQATENTGLTINVFWVIVAAANFIVFAIVIWALFFKPVSAMLESRRVRIEQGLKDADEARRQREAAADERLKTLTEARWEAAEILARAQKVAEDEHDRSLVETRAEIERLREQAVSEIDSERARAVNEVRAQVADLALLAAGKVVGESLTDERQHRLVEEFLKEVTPGSAAGAGRNN
jgi:F-type H+-transporting ATPase subunit b